MSSSFPERLKTAREKKGFTQSQLAERTGLQPSAVSHFEAGRRSPSFDNLKKLADALGVAIDYLLGRIDEPIGAGPLVQKLFRDMGRMTAADQDTLASFAAMLAAKNNPAGEGGNE
jgi:transcriptional regulator with XRE-family HTH domain